MRCLQKHPFVIFVTLALLTAQSGRNCAQQAGHPVQPAPAQALPAEPSLAQQAVSAVLKHYALNPLALDEKTGKLLPLDGKWSVSKTTPAVCPQTGAACAEVFYEVPAESVRCSWVVQLNTDGSDGKFLDEDDDTERYMLLKISDAEAKGLVIERKRPAFGALAMAAHANGIVRMWAEVGKNGKVEKIAMLSGPLINRQASIDAALSWTFRPKVIGTRAVPYQVQVVFTFKSMGPSNSFVDVAP